MRFEGKSVVVTGASAGMGYEIAKQFAAEGATVIAVARRKERLDQLAAETAGFAGKILPYAGDVSTKDVNEGMIEYAVAECGKLDILVNNAGIPDEFRPLTELGDDQWDRVIAVNLTGPMYAMRKAVQVMSEAGKGNILNIASIAGVNGCRAGAAYTASKYALVGLTKNTAFMYADKGIRCNVICPGNVETEIMNSQANISQTGVARVMAGLDASIGAGKAEDIASAVLYVTSDDAKFMNGSEVVIDGGVSCN